jgi:hypothetical protein
MSPGASPFRHYDGAGRWGGVVWPSLIAILFAALSVISFAIDQSIALSPPPEPPVSDGSR